MLSVKNLVIAVVLLLVSGMAQAGRFTADLTNSKNDFYVVFSGGGHHEGPFAFRVEQGTKETVRRDCASEATFRAIANPGGAEPAGEHTIKRNSSDEDCDDWTISVSGDVASGFKYAQK